MNNVMLTVGMVKNETTHEFEAVLPALQDLGFDTKVTAKLQGVCIIKLNRLVAEYLNSLSDEEVYELVKNDQEPYERIIHVCSGYQYYNYTTWQQVDFKVVH